MEQQTKPTPEQIQEKLKAIQKGNDVNVLMRKLSEAMELPEGQVPADVFVNTFIQINSDKLEAEAFMQQQFQEQFLINNQPKKRRLNKKDI